jgi:hypothetical protein
MEKGAGTCLGPLRLFRTLQLLHLQFQLFDFALLMRGDDDGGGGGGGGDGGSEDGYRRRRIDIDASCCRIPGKTP